MSTRGPTVSVPAPDATALAEAVRNAQRGDTQAYTLLFQHYKPLIWQHLIYLIGEKEVVYDLFQETFLRAWRKLPETSAEMNFTAWLKRIAANLAIDHLRRERKVVFVPLDDKDETILAALNELSSPGPEEQVSEIECIQLALAQLPSRYRICVLLQDQWGFSQREIAHLLEISEKCVSAYVSRGREHMRRAYLSYNSDYSTKTREQQV